MTEGFQVSRVGERLGEQGKEGEVFATRTRKKFRNTVLGLPITLPRGYFLAVKQFKPRKSANRILREATFQQRAAEYHIAPRVVGINTEEKYIVMERCDARIMDEYRDRALPESMQYMLCALMARLDGLNILHNDGNIRNLMIKQGKPILIDYGMSKKLPRGKSNFNTTLWMFVRTLARYNIDVPIVDACTRAKNREDFIRTGEQLLSPV